MFFHAQKTLQKKLGNFLKKSESSYLYNFMETLIDKFFHLSLYSYSILCLHFIHGFLILSMYLVVGTILMQSALLTRGYRVSKERVWRCLREIDPVGVATRRRKSIRRRVYKVKAANSLWYVTSIEY